MIGTIGAVAYFWNDGALIADLQAKLSTATDALDKSEKDKKDLRKENASLAAQIDQLLSKKSGDKIAADDEPAAPAPGGGPGRRGDRPDLGPLASIGRNFFRGGNFQNPQQRIVMLQARLKLSPEQNAKIKAALDADQKARQALFQQAFQNGGKFDPQAVAAANTINQTLASVLNPEQQRQYAQLQADEKQSRADTAATSQLNSVAPLLQLSQTQSDQIYKQLHDMQMSQPDPMSVLGNPTAMAAANPDKSTDMILKQTLTADQYSLYQQDQAAQGGRRRGNNPQTNPANTAPQTGAGTGTVPVITTSASTGQSVTFSGMTGTASVSSPGTATTTSAPAATTQVNAASNVTSNAAPATTGTTAPAQ